VTSLTRVYIEQMRDQVFFEGPERQRRLSRYWLLLLLSAVIATAGVVSDSTATVIGAMIIAPLMTPILGVVLGVVTADGVNLRRCLLLLAAGSLVTVSYQPLPGYADGGLDRCRTSPPAAQAERAFEHCGPKAAKLCHESVPCRTRCCQNAGSRCSGQVMQCEPPRWPAPASAGGLRSGRGSAGAPR
jgi:hypothetical protein